MKKADLKKTEIIAILFFIVAVLLVNSISAEKINIEIKNNYFPGEIINFKIVVYDDNNQPIDEKVDFAIKDYYSDIIIQGKAKSGEEMNFKLPENSLKGYWAVSAKYKTFENKALFNVLELEKADIKLEGDKLIITNIGNVLYKKSLQISIGNYKETALVPLEIGQKKEIRLTAPAGEYEVRVNDGTQKEDIIFSKVSLTGNVIGLERVDSRGFWKKYPLISLFILTFILVVIIIVSNFAFKNFRDSKKKK